KRVGGSSFANQAIESIEERGFDFGATIEMLQQERGSLERRERFAARLAAYSAIARPMPRVEDEAPEPEEPRVAPPQGLGLAPAAVEQHDAFEAAQHRILVGCRCSRPVNRNNLPLEPKRRGPRRAELEHPPFPCIGGTAECTLPILLL